MHLQPLPHFVCRITKFMTIKSIFHTNANKSNIYILSGEIYVSHINMTLNVLRFPVQLFDVVLHSVHGGSVLRGVRDAGGDEWVELPPYTLHTR